MLTRLATTLTRWTSRWVPNAFSIACLLTLLTLVLGVTLGGSGPVEVLRAWGDGFWTLLSFGMQMSLIVFAGYIVAVSPPVRALLDRLAQLPRSPTGAVAMMALIAMLIAWIHWGLGLVASAVMVGFMARHHPKADYRLLVAVSYFGLGATWHAGLSGSVPLLLATEDNFLVQKGILDSTLPISQTLLMPFNLLFTGVVIALLTLLAALMHPSEASRVTLDPESARKLIQHDAPPRPSKLTPAGWLEHSPLINAVIGGLGLAWIALHFAARGAAGLDLDTINFIFLTAAILLHLRPASLVHVAPRAAEPLHGIVLQFPLYAGMFGIIKGTALSRKLADAFVSLASARTFPLIAFWYSGILNYFVPSGGSKWAIEAPYLLSAAEQLGVPVERVAMAYAYGDMSTNLIQPFWAIPLLSVAKLEFSEILGFEAIAFVCYALVSSLALVTVY